MFALGSFQKLEYGEHKKIIRNCGAPSAIRQRERCFSGMVMEGCCYADIPLSSHLSRFAPKPRLYSEKPSRRQISFLKHRRSKFAPPQIICQKMYVPGFGEASPEAKAANQLHKFFTYVAVRIVSAQLESYNKEAYEELNAFLSEHSLNDGDEFCASLMRESPRHKALGIRYFNFDIVSYLRKIPSCYADTHCHICQQSDDGQPYAFLRKKKGINASSSQSPQRFSIKSDKLRQIHRKSLADRAEASQIRGMEGVGARLGRSSTRYGPAVVFTGRVRKWKKRWIHVSPSAPDASGNRKHGIANGTSDHSQMRNLNGSVSSNRSSNGSHLLLYKWTPLSQSNNSNGGGNAASNGDDSSTAVEERPKRRFKFVPITVLEEQKNEDLEQENNDEEEEAEPAVTSPDGVDLNSQSNGLNDKPDINDVPMEDTQGNNLSIRQDLNESTLDLSLG
ncbi:hypothetical protein SAY86_014559 [Trapa natans]|uniref:Uncharacterized protein n=1 Tax=Trapa natans TaxID=22666 RepID=A0AAN7KWP7_TRANT|nr:hypothetical protein SAY86_014559 [Trapa natans]